MSGESLVELFIFVDDDKFPREELLHLLEAAAAGLGQEEEEDDPAEQRQAAVEEEGPGPGEPRGQEQEGHRDQEVAAPVGGGGQGGAGRPAPQRVYLPGSAVARTKTPRQASNKPLLIMWFVTAPVCAAASLLTVQGIGAMPAAKETR